VLLAQNSFFLFLQLFSYYLPLFYLVRFVADTVNMSGSHIDFFDCFSSDPEVVCSVFAIVCLSALGFVPLIIIDPKATVQVPFVFEFQL
jgi:hypothetical protein